MTPCKTMPNPMRVIKILILEYRAMKELIFNLDVSQLTENFQTLIIIIIISCRLSVCVY